MLWCISSWGPRWPWLLMQLRLLPASTSRHQSRMRKGLLALSSALWQLQVRLEVRGILWQMQLWLTSGRDLARLHTQGRLSSQQGSIRRASLLLVLQTWETISSRWLLVNPSLPSS